ncbi:hypothetical protein P9112_009868 [Eukaryota sp. TZLM1-RC]
MASIHDSPLLSPQENKSDVFLRLGDLSDYNSPQRSGSVETLLADMNKGIPSTILRERRSPSMPHPSISPPSYTPLSKVSTATTEDYPHEEILSRLNRLEHLLVTNMSPSKLQCPHCRGSLSPSNTSSSTHMSTSSPFKETENRLRALTTRTNALKQKLMTATSRGGLETGSRRFERSFDQEVIDKMTELESRIKALEDCRLDRVGSEQDCRFD